MQHIDIIIAIPKSDRLLRFQPVIFQHALASCSFPAICRNNVYRTVPPCRYPGMVHIFHYQRIFPLTAPQHDLINVLLQQVFKIICDLQWRPGNPQILLKISVKTICNYPVVCRDADRTMNAGGIRDQFPDVIRRDGIAEQYLTGIKAIGTVKCQENIKVNPGKMRQFQRVDRFC